jgi:surface protein
VTVLVVIGFQGWFSDFSSSLFVSVDKDTDSSNNNLGVERLIDEYLYVQAGDDLNISSILIDGTDCSVSSSYSGLVKINVAGCVNNLTTQSPEIVIVTNAGIINEYVYVEKLAQYELPPLYVSNLFVSTWNTSLNSTGSSNKTSITLPLEASGIYSFVVDWGDGISSFVDAWDSVNVTHTYATEGVYIIQINGTIVGFRFNNGGDKLKILNIGQWGNLRVGNNNGYFYGATNLDSDATDSLDLTGTTTLYNMFNDASSLTGDLSGWNTSNVENMQSMFRDASSFTSNLSGWDVSTVTSMSNMFLSAAIFNSNLNMWKTSKVISMSYMFTNADSFDGNISLWDVSNVIGMTYMFSDAAIFNVDISSWDVHNVTSMSGMFNAAVLFNQNLSSWNVSSVMSCSGFNTSTGSWTLPQPNFSSC